MITPHSHGNIYKDVIYDISDLTSLPFSHFQVNRWRNQENSPVWGGKKWLLNSEEHANHVEFHNITRALEWRELGLISVRNMFSFGFWLFVIVCKVLNIFHISITAVIRQETWWLVDLIILSDRPWQCPKLLHLESFRTVLECYRGRLRGEIFPHFFFFIVCVLLSRFVGDSGWRVSGPPCRESRTLIGGGIARHVHSGLRRLGRVVIDEDWPTFSILMSFIPFCPMFCMSEDYLYFKNWYLFFVAVVRVDKVKREEGDKGLRVQRVWHTFKSGVFGVNKQNLTSNF